MATDAAGRVERERRAALLHGIYAIVNDAENALALARAVLAAGVRIVQYRAKNGIPPQRARELRALTRQRGAILLLDDDWRAARALDCDGVHLGPDDDGFADPQSVRAAMPERLIGLSCGNAREIAHANAAGVDYVGVGAVYATGSKPDAGAPIGILGLRRLAQATALPVAAIGGITRANLAEIRAAGVAMAAVISAISGAADPEAAAAELVAGWG